MDDLFTAPSSEEFQKRISGNFAPLEADDYIGKVVELTVATAPTFENKKPNYNNPHPVYEGVLLVTGLRAGGEMSTYQTKEQPKEKVEPNTRWLFFNVDPVRLGFQQNKVDPSYARGFLSHMMGIDPKDEIKQKGFVLLDPALKPVHDPRLVKLYYDERTGQVRTRELTDKGYTAIPDFLQFVGKYISFSLEIKRYTNNSGQEVSTNKITRFTKLPSVFKAPDAETDSRLMNDFVSKRKEQLAKKIQKQQGVASSPAVSSDITTEELGVNDVPW